MGVVELLRPISYIFLCYSILNKALGTKIYRAKMLGSYSIETFYLSILQQICVLNHDSFHIIKSNYEE